MSLHQVKIGTQVTVRATGDIGSIKEVYNYPTTYKVELFNGSEKKYKTHDLDIEGTTTTEPGIIGEKISKRLNSGKDYNVGLLHVKTVVWQEIKAGISDVWIRIISLKDYHLWYPGIQRILPLNDMGRYVHHYSFDQFYLKSGSHVMTRTRALSPFLNGKIKSLKKEKLFTLSLRINPLLKELVQFELEEKDGKVLVTCTRTYNGLFSLIGYIGFHRFKSFLLKDFQQIFFPEVANGKKKKEEKNDDTDSVPVMDRATTIAYAVNKGMDGDMDFINSILDKPTRGLAKAALVRAKRTGIVPPMPDMPSEKALFGTEKLKLTSDGIPVFEATLDTIHYAVNLALDGNMDVINKISDKPTRGKAKALMVKCKRTGERPPMPDVPVETELSVSADEDNSSPQFKSSEDLIHYAVNKALDGDMEFINSIEEKLIRGKAKAMMVKSKRTGDRPPMPQLQNSGEKSEQGKTKTVETEEELMKRLIAAGKNGDMEETNALDNRVLRGKIKAAIVREKRNKEN